jgi:uncharacterized protein (TIGR03067 family)
LNSASSSRGSLEGTWVPVAADVSGQALAVEELRVSRLVLHHGGYQIIDKADHVVDRGDYRVDDSVFPQAIDIVGISGPYAGRTMFAIYELQGDRLKVCYDLESAIRPDDMQAEGEELLLSITYARASTVLS